MATARKLLVFCFAVICFAVEFSPLAAQIVPVETLTPLPNGRRKHGAIVHQQNLYIFGGQEALGDRYLTTVIGSPLNEQGEPISWILEESLPASRALIEQNVVAVRDRIYIVGGLNGVRDEWVDEVLSVGVQLNGRLENWRTEAPLPAGPREGIVVASSGEHIYVLGGIVDGASQADVYFAQPSPTGAIDEWTATTPFPAGRAYSGAGIHSGRLFLWGGKTASAADSAVTDCYSAPIQEDGKLGEWRQESVTMLAPVFSGYSAVIGDYAMTFVPVHTNDGSSADVYFTTISNNRMGNWHRMTAGLIPRRHIGGASSDRGRVYLTGGQRTASDGTLATDQINLIRVQVPPKTP